MTWFAALTLVAVMLPLAAMPSSSVALVVARAAGSGIASGMAAAAGIVAGDLVFIALALLGMSALADVLGGFFVILKYCAGAYLIWLGMGLLRPSGSEPRTLPPVSRTTLAADFFAGLFLTLGDIKAILFYASLFPAILDMGALSAWDIAVIGGITIISVGGVKLGYVIFAERITAGLKEKVWAGEAPRRLGGVLLTGCGAVLIARA